jgi:uncharacterized Tic20 family protein
MENRPSTKARGSLICRLLFVGGICLCAVGLLGPLVVDLLPADGFPLPGGSGKDGFYRIVPVEQSSHYFQIVITLIGIVLICFGAILQRRAR